MATRKAKIFMSSITSYLLAEILIGSFDILPRIELHSDYERLSNIYRGRHVFNYKLNHPDSEFGFAPKTKTEGWATFGEGNFLVATDDLGFRNSLANQETAEIAVVGDSFTFGYGVNEEETWPKILEFLTGKEVANFGVVSYAPWQYNLILNAYPPFFENKLVLYCLYPNDYASENETETGGDYYSQKGWDLYQKSNPSTEDMLYAFYSREPFFKKTIAFKIYKTFFEAPIKAITTKGIRLFRNTWLKDTDLSEQNLALVHQRIRKAKRTIEEYNSRMAVVFFPSKSRVFNTEYQKTFGDDHALVLEDRIRSDVKYFCDDLKLPFLDLTDSFEQRHKRGDLLYMRTDPHLNTEGNMLAAHEIMDLITDY